MRDLRVLLACLLVLTSFETAVARADDAPQAEETIQAQSAPDDLSDDEVTEGDMPQPVTLRLDQGFILALPAGWELEGAYDDPADATGRKRVRVVCRMPECRRTQETCTFVLRADPVEGHDDAGRLAALHAPPLSRYFRLRAVLKNTSAGATIRAPLGPVRIGPRDWIAIETEAAPRFKSGFFAETVIGGRYLGAICKTCETGSVRFTAARAILESVRRPEQSAAR